MRKAPNKPTDFLKGGHDNEFDKAMNSINDMYDDLFKTTDYYSRDNISAENLELFKPIENMWNDIMEIPEEQKQPEHEEIVLGEPVHLP
jgi:hypothetical protein